MHRDIKTDNIFQTKEGAYKLSDFGFARTLSESPMTRCATAVYAAPELFEDYDYDDVLDKPLALFNNKVDVWSLGVVVFECATGELPFEAPTQIKLEQEIRRGAPAFESIENEDVRRIAQRMLTVAQEDRPTIKELFTTEPVLWDLVVAMGRE